MDARLRAFKTADPMPSRLSSDQLAALISQCRQLQELAEQRKRVMAAGELQSEASKASTVSAQSSTGVHSKVRSAKAASTRASNPSKLGKPPSGSNQPAQTAVAASGTSSTGSRSRPGSGGVSRAASNISQLPAGEPKHATPSAGRPRSAEVATSLRSSGTAV